MSNMVEKSGNENAPAGGEGKCGGGEAMSYPHLTTDSEYGTLETLDVVLSDTEAQLSLADRHAVLLYEAFGAKRYVEELIDPRVWVKSIRELETASSQTQGVRHGTHG